MSIITENHPKWLLYSQLRKCGEITASDDGRHFGLSCGKCRSIFPWINIKDFLRHIHEQHADDRQKQKQYQTHKQSNKKRKVSPTSSPLGSTFPSPNREDAKLEPVSPEEEKEEDISELVIETVLIQEEEELSKSDSKLLNDSEEDKRPSKTDSMSSSDNDDDDHNFDKNTSAGDKLDLLSIENRSVLNYIIDGHRKNPILWDKEHPNSQMFRKKLQIYNEMTKEIESYFKVKLTYMGVREAFADLRKMYSEQLLDEKHVGNIQIAKTELWCFEKLDFLRSKEIADHSSAPVVPDEKLMQLAEIYKLHPVLWNLDCEESHHKLQKVETQHEMLHKANAKFGWNMTLKQMRERLTRLRKLYVANKRKRLKCAANNEEFAPDNPVFYAQLGFLEPYIGPFRCEQCSAEISSFYAFKRHAAAHAGRLQYACRYCHKDFKLYANMQIHERRHTGEKPFVCSYCGAGFASSTDLNLHQTRHTGEKKHVCSVCGLRFGTASHLRNHKIRKHVHHSESKSQSLKPNVELIDDEVYISFPNFPNKPQR